MITAFGETKGLKLWLRDPRCQVKSTKTIDDRIKAGCDSDKAIGTPSTASPSGGASLPTHPDHNLYRNWAQLLLRTSNPATVNYVRGITDGEVRLDPSWHDFPAYSSWAKANGYRHGWFLHRRDKTKGFTPTNCYWGEGKDTSLSNAITAWDETKTINRWLLDKRCKAPLWTIRRRLHAGWPAEKALGNYGCIVKEADDAYTKAIIKSNWKQAVQRPKLPYEQFLKLEADILAGNGETNRALGEKYGVSAARVIQVRRRLRFEFGLPEKPTSQQWQSKLKQWRRLRPIAAS